MILVESLRGGVDPTFGLTDEDTSEAEDDLAVIVELGEGSRSGRRPDRTIEAHIRQQRKTDALQRHSNVSWTTCGGTEHGHAHPVESGYRLDVRNRNIVVFSPERAVEIGDKRGRSAPRQSYSGRTPTHATVDRQ